MAVGGRIPLIVDRPTIPCPEADDALKYALLGIFCFGFVLEPMAISKAVNARKRIKADPRLMGYGKTTVALVIGIVAGILWILGLISRVNPTPEVQR
jgi:hypothetical protein